MAKARSIYTELGQALRLESIRGILLFCKVRKRLTTYRTVADALGMFSGGKELAGLLGQIQDQDNEAGQPLLSSLVVSKVTGFPGKGYFEKAATLGYDLDEPAPSDPTIVLGPKRLAFWHLQIEKLGIDWDSNDPWDEVNNPLSFKCSQCGARKAEWQDDADDRCPYHADPNQSCDGVLVAQTK